MKKGPSVEEGLSFYGVWRRITIKMTNELLLILSIIGIYGSVLLWLYLFGKQGLMAFTTFATITANIEVLVMVKAFGMEMTLGNILFAATFFFFH